MKTLKQIFALTVCILMAYGCGSDVTNPSSSPAPSPEETEVTDAIENGDQKTTFLLTDAASDSLEGMVVSVESPIVVTTQSGAINIPLPDDLPIRIDLLELDGVSDLLGSGEVPAGEIKDIKLTVSDPEMTLLDGTVLAKDDIALENPVMTIVPDPNAPITVQKGEGTTVQLDIDVDQSVQLDLTGTGTPVFRPKGRATRISKEKHPNGVKMREVYGTIAAIPGIKDNPKSFLLKRGGNKQTANAEKGRQFLRVDASEAKIFRSATSTEEIEFSALKVDQRIEVGGIFTERGVLKASSLFITPDKAGPGTLQRPIHGVIMNLNRMENSFDLRRPPKDRAASSTDMTTPGHHPKPMSDEGLRLGTSTIKVTYDPAKVLIVMERPHHDTASSTPGTQDFVASSTMKLGPEALANGQPVFVRGTMATTTPHLLEARVIVIKPVRFKGFIAAVHCAVGSIEVINLPKHNQNATSTIEEWSVDIRSAKLLRPDHATTTATTTKERSKEIPCDNLHKGMGVYVVGMLVPPLSTETGTGTGTSTIQIKASVVEVILVHHISGEVKSVLPVSPKTGQPLGFVLNVPAGKHGIAAPQGCQKGTDSPILSDCPSRELIVYLAENFYNPDKIFNSTPLIPRRIHFKARVGGLILKKPPVIKEEWAKPRSLNTF